MGRLRTGHPAHGKRLPLFDFRHLSSTFLNVSVLAFHSAVLLSPLPPCSNCYVQRLMDSLKHPSIVPCEPDSASEIERFHSLKSIRFFLCATRFATHEHGSTVQDAIVLCFLSPNLGTKDIRLDTNSLLMAPFFFLFFSSPSYGPRHSFLPMLSRYYLLLADLKHSSISFHPSCARFSLLSSLLCWPS